METAVKQHANAAHRSVTSIATGGKAMPAVPVLQQKPKEPEEAPLQKMPANADAPTTRFTAPPAVTLPPDEGKPGTPFAVQRAAAAPPDVRTRFNSVQKNNTGLPDNLKTGVENLSGFSMDDVKVHYNSERPAQLQAHAYAQGTDIHIAPGQERHLPHEAWHVVQQKQGRVRETMQMKNTTITDRTEFNAEIKDQKVTPSAFSKGNQNNSQAAGQSKHFGVAIIQRMQLMATAPNEREKDFAIINNVAFAQQINVANGVKKEKMCSLFGDYSASDLDFKNGEVIFVHGHGLHGFFQEPVDGKGHLDGLITWFQAADEIAKRIKKGANGHRLEIRMLSCHGADMGPSADNPKLPSFVLAMVKLMEVNALQGNVTAFKGPVVSWVGMGDITHEENPNINEEGKKWMAENDKLHKQLKKEFDDFISKNQQATHQKRLDFVRNQHVVYRVEEHIKKGIKAGALIPSKPIKKETASGGKETVEERIEI